MSYKCSAVPHVSAVSFYTLCVLLFSTCLLCCVLLLSVVLLFPPCSLCCARCPVSGDIILCFLMLPLVVEGILYA